MLLLALLLRLLAAVLRLAGRPAARRLLARRHDGGALRRLQRGGALRGLHVGAHGAVEAVEVDVDQDRLGPPAVCAEAQADGGEGAVVVRHALALLELDQLAHSVLVAARVLEVGGERGQVLVVHGVVGAVAQVPGGRVASQAAGGEPDAGVVVRARAGPEPGLVHEAVDVVGVAVELRGIGDPGRFAEDLRLVGVGICSGFELRDFGGERLNPLLRLLDRCHVARRGANLATERRVEDGRWDGMCEVLGHASENGEPASKPTATRLGG